MCADSITLELPRSAIAQSAGRSYCCRLHCCAQALAIRAQRIGRIGGTDTLSIP